MFLVSFCLLYFLSCHAEFLFYVMVLFMQLNLLSFTLWLLDFFIKVEGISRLPCFCLVFLWPPLKKCSLIWNLFCHMISSYPTLKAVWESGRRSGKINDKKSWWRTWKRSRELKCWQEKKGENLWQMPLEVGSYYDKWHLIVTNILKTTYT